MKVRKPVIASDTVGLKEIVEDGKNGLVFKVGDAKSLTKMIVYGLKNPKVLKNITRCGWSFQQSRFTVPQMVKEHFEFYQTIINLPT